MGGYSVIKLVKPIKILCSWTPHQSSVSHRLLSKTEAYIGTAAARVLGETDAAVRQKVRRLDATDRAFHQANRRKEQSDAGQSPGIKTP
jgi:hypothetical protein